MSGKKVKLDRIIHMDYKKSIDKFSLLMEDIVEEESEVRFYESELFSEEKVQKPEDAISKLRS